MSKNRPHARRAARSRAFQVLYSLQFSPSTTLGDVRTAFLEMPDPTDADMDENAETREEKLYGFAWELVEGVWSNVKNLDSVIERFSQNWRVDRLGKIELTLLRLAVFEMLYRADVPPKVAINEALELFHPFRRRQGQELHQRHPRRGDQGSGSRYAHSCGQGRRLIDWRGLTPRRAGVDPAPDYTAIRISHEQA